MRDRYLWQHERVRRVIRRLPKNNQNGFTLIELLVVISILGILAAVVTMSMVGITKIAQDNAAKTEEQTVQVAYDTMLADQGVPAGSECTGATLTGGTAKISTNTSPTDMSAFPDSTAWASSPAHLPVALYPHYLRQQETHGAYHCAPNGQIVQDSYTP